MVRIARQARDRYAFDEGLFAVDGEAVVLEQEPARAMAAQFVEDVEARARATTEIAAIGLLHELAHRAVAAERRTDPAGIGPLGRGLTALDARFGRDGVDRSLLAFEAAFPVPQVYRDELDAAEWLARDISDGAGADARESGLEELALAAIGAANPAAAAYRELIDDDVLAAAAQRRIVDSLAGADLRPDDPDADRTAPARSLLARLREPMQAAPQSLAAQLRWIRVHWAGWLDDADLLVIDRQLGRLDELDRAAWLRARRQAGAADTDAAVLSGFGLDDEPEAFSEDRDWMAELVLVAKSTYVWLAQLSRAYGHTIERLDQVPDEELDELRARGFTGLWLIGLWERSHASRRIKQMRGNPEAMASAYSVADYRIADELGGDAAWRDLRDRAAARGLRLAADMVPNHMGIDSRWVVEHPERFISSPHPPFEAYRFTGDDLSSDGRVIVQLEDHYWDASDASVVFKRIDRASGEARYIYHGNDGTSFPWNDTAQLDYLRADVREAVIGQILDVARRFPVIRFDAAMVLARRHIQRLWYPLPGHEAGIPSRSAAALPAHELLRRMPLEFWREVVDRVAAEVPDTLLLAEAFWLMEGYFVRTLGMHRVYNSAFMHMLRDEKNAQYQQVIRETVAFDPRILGRYVNFMNNPDERSAIDQFGSHDKYFGVATLLATLPGLPMFGHGQVEGYSEQYGMEFRRPQRDETPNEDLVARHRREIFPLLRERWRFAGWQGFRQLSATDGAGEVPDVYAYANRAHTGPADAGERRSLVVFLNRYPRASVRIVGVAEALGLGDDPAGFVILRDQRSGLQYLRHLRDTRERGLELSLDGYASHVFLGFEEVSDSDGAGWTELARRTGLAGIPDAWVALRWLRTEPLRDAVAALFATASVQAAFLPPQETATARPAKHRPIDRPARPCRRDRAPRGAHELPRRRERAGGPCHAAAIRGASHPTAPVGAGRHRSTPLRRHQRWGRRRRSGARRGRLRRVGWCRGGRRLRPPGGQQRRAGLASGGARPRAVDPCPWLAPGTTRVGPAAGLVRARGRARRRRLEPMARGHLPVPRGLGRAGRRPRGPRRPPWLRGRRRGCDRTQASSRREWVPARSDRCRRRGVVGTADVTGDRLGDLVADIAICRRCPRLVAWRESIAVTKVARHRRRSTGVARSRASATPGRACSSSAWHQRHTGGTAPGASSPVTTRVVPASCCSRLCTRLASLCSPARSRPRTGCDSRGPTSRLRSAARRRPIDPASRNATRACHSCPENWRCSRMWGSSSRSGPSPGTQLCGCSPGRGMCRDHGHVSGTAWRHASGRSICWAATTPASRTPSRDDSMRPCSEPCLFGLEPLASRSQGGVGPRIARDPRLRWWVTSAARWCTNRGAVEEGTYVLRERSVHHRRRTPMLSRRALSPAGAIVLLAALAVPVAAQDAQIEIVAEGLVAPRGVTIAPDGSIYVAEAGSGGETCMPGPRGGDMCMGPTGAVTRVADGTSSRVIEGLALGRRRARIRGASRPSR